MGAENQTTLAEIIWLGNLTGVGGRLEDFLNFLSWDPALFDPSDSVDSLTYRVLVAACGEATSTFSSTQTHSLAAHWRQRNWEEMEAHKATRREKQEEKSGRGAGVSSSPTDITGERDARVAEGAMPPPPPPPPPPPAGAVKPRPGLIPA